MTKPSWSAWGQRGTATLEGQRDTDFELPKEPNFGHTMAVSVCRNSPEPPGNSWGIAHRNATRMDIPLGPKVPQGPKKTQAQVATTLATISVWPCNCICIYMMYAYGHKPAVHTEICSWKGRKGTIFIPKIQIKIVGHPASPQITPISPRLLAESCSSWNRLTDLPIWVSENSYTYMTYQGATLMGKMMIDQCHGQAAWD